MRVAFVSDIHGNRTALEAVLKDLQETAPDGILHGGDLADAGSSPVETVDCIRGLGWPGVVGNTDEMLFRPESLEEFARQSAAPAAVWDAVREMADATRALLGEERIAWLRGLPRVQRQGSFALVHATPESLWRAPGPAATDAELESAYGALGESTVVYGHIHRAYVRRIASPLVGERLVVNAGSVSLSYDGDRRAAYLLLDAGSPAIRRVEYDVEKEVRNLSACSLPHADWIARSLRAASPGMP